MDAPLADGVAKLFAEVPDLITAVPRAVAAAIGPVAPVANSASAVNSSAIPAAKTAKPATSPASAASAVVPAASAVGSATDQVSPAPAPLSRALATVPDIVTQVNTLVASVSNLLVTPVYAVYDVIRTVQDMLTSVAVAAVPLMQLAADLPALMGVVAAEPGVPGFAHAGTGPSTAVNAPVAPQLPLALPLSGVPRLLSSAVNATGVATVEGIAASTLSVTTHVGTASWLPGAAASLVSHGSIHMDGVRSFFPHGFGQLLLTVSLTALALAALPGAGGLALFTAVGVRLGYRQAKAGFAIRSAGFAQFAHSGPLGIVRSGSIVAIRPRATRVVRPAALRAVQLLDEVA